MLSVVSSQLSAVSSQLSVLLRKFRSGRDAGFERDLVTEIFQALDVIPGQAFGLETVEEVSAQVFVGRAIFEHMVENHQHRVPHRDQSPLPAPASCQEAGSGRGGALDAGDFLPYA